MLRLCRKSGQSSARTRRSVIANCACLTLGLLVLLIPACGKKGISSSEDACKDVDCGEAGECGIALDGAPVCVCAPGFHAVALACVEDDPAEPCTGVDCGGHGTCAVDAGAPWCLCDADYSNMGATVCVPMADPCDGIDCAGHGTCVVTPNGVTMCACDFGFRNADTETCVPDP